LLLMGCAASGGSVTRVVDGQAFEGRFVSHISYGAYAQAAHLEALGDYAAAEAGYSEALRSDPNSPQIWVRLGSVRCAMARPEAEAAFESAEHLQEAFSTLWYERGVCALARKKPKTALEAGRRALSLDPQHLLTTKLIADALVALGKPDDARRYLDALAAQNPDMPIVEVWRAQLVRTREKPAEASTLLRSLDRALLADDVEAARHLALDLGLSESELAARALALGKSRIALDHGQLVLAADPGDATAWITTLAAADLTRDEQAFRTALQALGDTPTQPGPLGRMLFAELLGRRVGPEAARAWLRAAPEEEGDDPLLDQHRGRLQQELSARPDSSLDE